MAYMPKQKGTTENLFQIGLSDKTTLTSSFAALTIDINADISTAPTLLIPYQPGAANGATIQLGGDANFNGGFWSAASNTTVFTSGDGTATDTPGGSFTVQTGGAFSGSDDNGGDLYLVTGAGDGIGVNGNINFQGNKVVFSISDAIVINSDPGSSGEVLTSQGSGSPPIWAAAGSSSGLTAVQSYALTSMFGPQF